ncbi:DUF2235 domain-containing protein [Sphingomonas sp. BIUV-7]|uniref:DUF2235 domain-containing protein n=1 Tax=Sphingomonas natans TaxID=3063330 RepID=A0ABT8YEN2_9SPHN|nr:DUF2235 domain-containing protein [Sphingomonas sp. BIUV-7]MDO6416825.1 DUF2235 domain-containing protein [Sphingomonas sp. BIUV-7]
MAKTLVVCCDGTWNTADQAGGPTNVTKMARAIVPMSPEGRAQIVYYDEGVGVGNVVERFVGGAIGTGLAENVQQAYRFCCLNYEPGDSILLFGFSRGAFTVRSLAGLIGLVGLLRKGDLEYMPDIWTRYRTAPAERTGLPDPQWKDAREADIDLVGVWDTVGSLGIPGNWFRGIARARYAFHDVRLGAKIQRAYHALAIDEQRKNFAPTIWDTSNLRKGQIVEQRWFAGVHSNIGGGYRDRVLSDITFLWMCEKVGQLLAFDQPYLETKVHRVAEGMAEGQLVNSAASLFYRALGKKVRVIGADASEGVHPSAIARYKIGQSDHDPVPYIPFPYDPKNMTLFLDQRQPAGGAS